MFSGGGLNPRKMKKMMEQMGIELEELEVEDVVITLANGEKLIFKEVEVTKMDARGQKTYQIVGDPEMGGNDQTIDNVTEISKEDIEMVMQKSDVDEETARKSIESTEGDLAAAIYRLK
jgi:nascent polypeptide-associated complex subunit alpha